MTLIGFSENELNFAMLPILYAREAKWFRGCRNVSSIVDGKKRNVVNARPRRRMIDEEVSSALCMILRDGPCGPPQDEGV